MAKIHFHDPGTSLTMCGNVAQNVETDGEAEVVNCVPCLQKMVLSYEALTLEDSDEESDNDFSYHDVYVETSQLKRTSIFDLPFNFLLTCNRVGGWSLFRNGVTIGSEYGGVGKGLKIDVDGVVILDALEQSDD